MHVKRMLNVGKIRFVKPMRRGFMDRAPKRPEREGRDGENRDPSSRGLAVRSAIDPVPWDRRESGRSFTIMRSAWIAALMMAGIAIGCASTDTGPTPEQSLTVTGAACTAATGMTQSPECANEAAAAEEKTRLVMAVWKACPEANPCLKLRACENTEGMYELSPTLPTSEALEDKASAACAKAQEQDSSCQSLLADSQYARIYRRKIAGLHGCYEQCDFPRGLRRGGGEYGGALKRMIDCEQSCETLWSPAEGDCKQAQAALADSQTVK